MRYRVQTIPGTKYCFFKNLTEYWTQFLVNVVLKLSLLRGNRFCRFTLDYNLWRSICRSAVDFTPTASSEWRIVVDWGVVVGGGGGGSRLVGSSSCILNVAERFFFQKQPLYNYSAKRISFMIRNSTKWSCSRPPSKEIASMNITLNLRFPSAPSSRL